MAQKFCSLRRKLPAIEAKYIGSRSVSGTLVVVQTEKGREQLRPRFDLIRHHPVGFDWAHTAPGQRGSP